MNNKFKAAVTRCGKQHYLGHHYSEKEAALACDRALIRTAAWRGVRPDKFNIEFEARQTMVAEPNEHELEMLNWLRTVNPGAERAAEIADRLADNLPDTLIELMEDHLQRTERHLVASQELMKRAVANLKRQAEEITALQDKNAFLTSAEAAARKDLSDLRSSGKQAGVPFKMVRVGQGMPPTPPNPVPAEIDAAAMLAQTETPPQA